MIADAYTTYQEKKFEEYEALCKRCGDCCGAHGSDPCEHLLLNNGAYSCDIYQTRYGVRRTRSGLTFMCVPIRDVINKSWHARPGCGYLKNGCV